MSSVRVTAAGAVMIASLSFFIAPVSACDDRYARKCEKAAAAAAAAEAQAETPVIKRKSVRHSRMAARVAKRVRVVTRTRAPGFAVKRERGMTLSSDATRVATLAPESALARRFRGFIDPQPIAQNTFEALRKPHLIALNMEPPGAMPSDPAAALAETTDSVAAAAKQDRIAKPAASIELPPVPTVTKQVALRNAFAAKPVAQADAVAAPALALAEPQVIPPQAMMTASASSAQPDDPGRFPVHKLVLALCGALGAASALRFIVRA
jgi:hypothetical protein